MVKRQKVKYQFLKYSSVTLGGSFTTTLVLSNPSSVEFILTGTAIGNGNAKINNTYNLDTLSKFITATAINPYFLKLDNNENEIDVTDYQITLFNVCDLTIIVKYFID